MGSVLLPLVVSAAEVRLHPFSFCVIQTYPVGQLESSGDPLCVAGDGFAII